MVLEVRRLVGDVSVRAGVRSGEAVVGERLDLIEEFLREAFRIPLCRAARCELLALGADELALLLRHHPPQLVGLPKRVVGHPTAICMICSW